jgi:Zn-dependent oligopeptidase
MLGVNNFAETVLPSLMAKNTSTVQTFLEDLAQKTIVKAN